WSALSQDGNPPRCQISTCMLVRPGRSLSGIGVWVDRHKSCECLASALTSKVSNLKTLDLSFNTLKDSGVQLLAAGLAKPHCRLERLKLSGCRVKQNGFAALAKALKSNPSHLRELDLSGNEPEESGVFHLVDGLKVVKCELQILKVVPNPMYTPMKTTDNFGDSKTNHSWAEFGPLAASLLCLPYELNSTFKLVQSV
uniref:SPRY-associated domain-containing protein n=1 Tax=Hucho hucho TaxID=62062 RepID=A0A4W5L4C9_9TELE